MFACVSARLAKLENPDRPRHPHGFFVNTGRSLDVNPALLGYAALHTPFAPCVEPYELSMAGNDVILAYQFGYLRRKIMQDHVKWTRCEALPPFILAAEHNCRFPPIIRNRVATLRRLHDASIRAANNQTFPTRDAVASPARVTLGKLKLNR
jgi:hypothetical protein